MILGCRRLASALGAIFSSSFLDLHVIWSELILKDCHVPSGDLGHRLDGAFELPVIVYFESGHFSGSGGLA